MAHKENEASKKRLWKGAWPFGLAALLATSLLYVPCFAFVATLGQTAHFAVALSFIGCAAMVVAGIAAIAVHGRKRQLGGPRTRMAGSISYVAGSLCFAAAAVSEAPHIALVAAAGVLQGIGGLAVSGLGPGLSAAGTALYLLLHRRLLGDCRSCGLRLRPACCARGPGPFRRLELCGLHRAACPPHRIRRTAKTDRGPGRHTRPQD